jgi:hypothetical protein
MSQGNEFPRVDDAIAVIQRMYCELTVEERRELDERLLGSAWFGSKIKWLIYQDQFTIRDLAVQHSKRSRNATAEDEARDEALAAEKKTKTWSQMFADHPEIEPETLRSRVRQAQDREERRRRTT